MVCSIYAWYGKQAYCATTSAGCVKRRRKPLTTLLTNVPVLCRLEGTTLDYTKHFTLTINWKISTLLQFSELPISNTALEDKGTSEH